jgi:L-malate glycosyltransferase
MYILIIARGYPSEKYIMNGIFEFDQAKALAKAGHKVVFAAIDMRSARRIRKWGFESFERSGVQVEAINIPCGSLPWKVLDILSVTALKMLYKRIERKYGTPDVIHAHFIDQGYIAARTFEGYNIPLVITEHYSGMNQEIIEPRLMKRGEFAYPRADKLIAVSGQLALNIKQKFGVEAEVVPNIVDTEIFEYGKPEKRESGFTFVSIGSLLPVKRMRMLIEAFYRAFKEEKSVKLYIYGQGSEHVRLEKLIPRYGLGSRVHIMVMRDRKEIAKKLRESQCFVLASASETFGVVYIEAMAMGLPVIATKCGGPEDFVDESNGVMIPVDDMEALAKAMKDMYRDIEKYDRKSISDMTRKKFSPEVIEERLIGIYKEVKR